MQNVSKNCIDADAEVIITIGSAQVEAKVAKSAKCYTNQKQMLSLPGYKLSKDAKLDLLKKICRAAAKLSSLGRCKEKLFNKRTPLLFLPKKNHRCLFHFQWPQKSQTVCVDNFVKERRFRKPIISLGTRNYN